MGMVAKLPESCDLRAAFRTMPSRKRYKGKERKAKANEKQSWKNEANLPMAVLFPRQGLLFAGLRMHWDRESGQTRLTL